MYLISLSLFISVYTKNTYYKACVRVWWFYLSVVYISRQCYASYLGCVWYFVYLLGVTFNTFCSIHAAIPSIHLHLNCIIKSTFIEDLLVIHLSYKTIIWSVCLFKYGSAPKNLKQLQLWDQDSTPPHNLWNWISLLYWMRYPNWIESLKPARSCSHQTTSARCAHPLLSSYQP